MTSATTKRTQQKRKSSGRKPSESLYGSLKPSFLAKRVMRYRASPVLEATARKNDERCYKIVPKHIAQNVMWRKELLTLCAKNLGYRQLVKRWCRSNILFWINAFVWALDTRETKAGTLAPFITFQCQDEAILKIHKAMFPKGKGVQHDCVIEKSRDQGATWICVLAFTHALLFSEQPIDLFCMSYKERVVDGGYDTIMGKARLLIEHLPSWLKPELQINNLSFKNEETGSTWSGSSTTQDAGVSGRYAAMFLDEFALVDDAEQIWHRTAACSNCRIVNSTHRGPEKMFAQIVKLSELAKVDQEITERRFLERIQLHWTAHPWKAKGLYYDAAGKARSPWYDDECIRLGNNRQAIAQELDMDAMAAGGQAFDVAEIMGLIGNYTRDPVRVGAMIDGKFVDQPRGHIKLWFKNEPPKGLYGIGNDVASGAGGKYSTPSCSSIVNLDTGCKVAELWDPAIRPDRFARVVFDLALWFYGAKLNFENTGSVGSMFRQTLLEDLGYTHFRMRKKSERTLAPELTNEIGWVPDPEAKTALLFSYQQALSMGFFVNPSKQAMEETLQFVYVDGVIKHSLERVKDDHSAAKALHGDLVMADAMAWLMVRESGVVQSKVENPGGQKQKGPPPYGSIAWRYEQDDRERDGWDGW